jgi:hypothetical protein
MIIEAGDEKRAAERILQLVKQYALRFDPPGQADFYARLVRGLRAPLESTSSFIHGDDVPTAKKPPQRLVLRSAGSGGIARFLAQLFLPIFVTTRRIQMKRNLDLICALVLFVMAAPFGVAYMLGPTLHWGDTGHAGITCTFLFFAAFISIVGAFQRIGEERSMDESGLDLLRGFKRR